MLFRDEFRRIRHPCCAALNTCLNILYFPQVKGLITRKLTTCLIVGYLPFQLTAASVFLIKETVLITIIESYSPSYLERSDCLLKNFRFILIVMDSVRLSINIVPNAIIYILLLVGTILFLVVFKRSIQARKSLTATKKQSDSAKEKRLMQSVLVVCVIYILTSGPRTIEKMISTGSNLFANINLLVHIPSYVKYVFLVLQAINHLFNIFVYLAINSTFRKIFCKIFMPRSHSMATK